MNVFIYSIHMHIYIYTCKYIYIYIQTVYIRYIFNIPISWFYQRIEGGLGGRSPCFSVAKPLFKASPDRFLVLMQDVQNWDCEERNFYVILYTNNCLYMYTTCRCVFLNVTTMYCLYQYVILYRIVLKRCSQSCLESWLHDYPTVRLEFEVESGKGGVG